MFQLPAARPRTAHLPLASAVTSGPPLEPFWMRSESLAPGTGLPVFLLTTEPASRLSPRQSSPANAVIATSASKAVAMMAIGFFKADLLWGFWQKKEMPAGVIPQRAFGTAEYGEP